ncbi:MAG: type VI secretion system contractile sheath small subunit [Betaproteobacteria bacterium]|nr:type VI secretion system contractile sheath small subunit [Betaproteobacteria bacterium]
MTRESSIAPKERINVTFKPATGGAVEEIELPMKVMVMGDFLQRFDSRPIMDRKPVSINKQNYAEVMAKQELHLETMVPNRLRDQEDSEDDMRINLKFNSMRDFEPGNIVEQMPELQQLMRLREALVSLKGPLGNLPAFRKALEDVLKDPRQREKLMSELGNEAPPPVNSKPLDNDGNVEPQNPSGKKPGK